MMFQRNILPPSSKLNSKPSNKSAQSRQQALYASFLLGSIFKPEDKYNDITGHRTPHCTTVDAI
jgi:hypothetical protein